MGSLLLFPAVFVFPPLRASFMTLRHRSSTPHLVLLHYNDTPCFCACERLAFFPLLQILHPPACCSAFLSAWHAFCNRGFGSVSPPVSIRLRGLLLTSFFSCVVRSFPSYSTPRSALPRLPHHRQEPHCVFLTTAVCFSAPSSPPLYVLCSPLYVTVLMPCLPARVSVHSHFLRVHCDVHLTVHRQRPDEMEFEI